MRASAGRGAESGNGGGGWRHLHLEVRAHLLHGWVQLEHLLAKAAGRQQRRTRSRMSFKLDWNLPRPCEGVKVGTLH